MSAIQGTKPSGRQQIQPLDTVVTMIKHNKSTIYHAIYINIFSELKVSYLMVSTDDVLNTTNNQTEFPVNGRSPISYFSYVESSLKDVSTLLNFTFVSVFSSHHGDSK